MTWLKSPFTKYERGDFIPIMIGGILLFWSLPVFIILLVDTDHGSAVVAIPLLVLFGVGIILGFGFLLFGIRLCSYPGSLTYRVTHARFFSR
jgi:hypothetical protein